MYEEQYRKARIMGVQFIRYEENRKPMVSASQDGTLTVTVFDEELSENITIDASMVVLARSRRGQRRCQ